MVQEKRRKQTEDNDEDGGGGGGSDINNDLPTQAAVLLWLLSDRRIQGPGGGEFLPSESCQPDAVPYKDQYPAAGQGPDCVPTEPTESA